MGSVTDNWYLSGELHIESEASNRPDKNAWQEHFGHPNIWGKFTKIATVRMWGLQNCYGLLQNWDTDSLFIGLKDEGSNRKDAVIAFGDDADESLRFLFAGAGFPPSPPKELLRITGSGNVGIGTIDIKRTLHVEGFEIHSGGAAGGFSFGDRGASFVENPLTSGKRWVWYSANGVARLWSGADKLSVTPNGELTVTGQTEIGSNPLRFSSGWTGSPDAVTNRAEISNDTNAHKTLMIVGNRSAGLGRRVSVWDRLEVNGDLTVTNLTEIGSNPLRFSSSWTASTDAGINRAEISNDTGVYKTLMIVGNNSAGRGRRVSVWDRLEVNGELTATGNLIVGAGGNASILVRHINGKHYQNDGFDGLFLNYATGQSVHIGGGQESHLYVHGALITQPISDARAKEILGGEANGTAIVGAANGINEARIDFFFKYRDRIYKTWMIGQPI